MPQAPLDLAQQPLVFTHIPKTAGTTVNFGLRKAFPDAAAFHLQRLREDELRDLAADREILIFAGHVPYCQTAAAFADSGREPRFVTVLRDPIERVLSAYAYAKGTPQERWHELAGQLDVNAFIAHMKKAQPQFLVGKQCRFLCPKAKADPDSAFRSLQDNFDLVGLQRDLEGFFRGLEQLTGRRLPHPKRRNQSAQPVGRDDLTADTLRILEETTAADRLLYARAVRWLAQESDGGLQA